MYKLKLVDLNFQSRSKSSLTPLTLSPCRGAYLSARMIETYSGSMLRIPDLLSEPLSLPPSPIGSMGRTAYIPDSRTDLSDVFDVNSLSY